MFFGRVVVCAAAAQRVGPSKVTSYSYDYGISRKFQLRGCHELHFWAHRPEKPDRLFG